MVKKASLSLKHLVYKVGTKLKYTTTIWVVGIKSLKSYILNNLRNQNVFGNPPDLDLCVDLWLSHAQKSNGNIKQIMGRAEEWQQRLGHRASARKCQFEYVLYKSYYYVIVVSCFRQFKCCGLRGAKDYIQAKLDIPESGYAPDNDHRLYFEGCLEQWTSRIGTLLKCSYITIGVEVGAKVPFPLNWIKVYVVFVL